MWSGLNQDSPLVGFTSVLWIWGFFGEFWEWKRHCPLCSKALCRDCRFMFEIKEFRNIKMSSYGGTNLWKSTYSIFYLRRLSSYSTLDCLCSAGVRVLAPQGSSHNSAAKAGRRLHVGLPGLSDMYLAVCPGNIHFSKPHFPYLKMGWT